MWHYIDFFPTAPDLLLLIPDHAYIEVQLLAQEYKLALLWAHE